MTVSVGHWQKQTYQGREIEFLGIQMPSFGFMLSTAEVEELHRKLRQLFAEGTCQSNEGDALFVDLDNVTREEPFVILTVLPESRGLAWFCDIPEQTARELYAKLGERLKTRNA